MTYTINNVTNIVTRDSDGAVVSPCQTVEDPMFLEYKAWVEAGNIPTAIDTMDIPDVPQSVTMRQARLALLNYGIYSTVDNVIGSLPSPQKEAAQIEWDYATDVLRSSPLVSLLTANLGLTEEAVDALFIAASTL